MNPKQFMDDVMLRTGAESVRLSASMDVEDVTVSMFFEGGAVLSGLIEPTDWNDCDKLLKTIAAYVDEGRGGQAT